MVTTYGVLQRDSGIFAETVWDMVVADEAQSVKNPDSLAAQALEEPFDQTADPGAFAARSAKLTALDELLDRISACGESILIFTSYVEMGHLLQAHPSARGQQPAFLSSISSIDSPCAGNGASKSTRSSSRWSAV